MSTRKAHQLHISLGGWYPGSDVRLPRDHLASEWPGCDLKIPVLEPDSQDSTLAEKGGRRKSREIQDLMKGQGCSHSMLCNGDLSTAFFVLGKHKNHA